MTLTLENVQLNKPTTLAVVFGEGNILRQLEETKEYESGEQTREIAISVNESSA